MWIFGWGGSQLLIPTGIISTFSNKLCSHSLYNWMWILLNVEAFAAITTDMNFCTHQEIWFTFINAECPLKWLSMFVPVEPPRHPSTKKVKLAKSTSQSGSFECGLKTALLVKQFLYSQNCWSTILFIVSSPGKFMAISCIRIPNVLKQRQLTPNILMIGCHVFRGFFC